MAQRMLGERGNQPGRCEFLESGPKGGRQCRGWRAGGRSHRGAERTVSFSLAPQEGGGETGQETPLPGASSTHLFCGEPAW